MAEGARLESVYAGNRIEGSNPSPSANYPSNAIQERPGKSLYIWDLVGHLCHCIH